MVVVVGALAFAWGVLVTAFATGSVPTIIGSWGATHTHCSATVDLYRLLSFRNNYDFALVCGFGDPTVDKLTDTRISISKLFIIRPESLSITMPISAEMSDGIKRLTSEARTSSQLPSDAPIAVPVWWEPVLIKKGTNMAIIHSLADVVRYGGKILRPQYID